MLIKPADTERVRDATRVLHDQVDPSAPSGVRRDHARGVAGMDAGLLDVLEDPADEELGAVVDRVDVHLDGVLQELVDQNGMSGATRAAVSM